tara:strand:- start:19845 stop:21467 length:1623 start_codon:yes stop_codon:yes gene_type:complete
MALNIIRKRLDDDYDALSLLDALPSHDAFEWVRLPGDDRMALKIGTAQGRDIVAFVLQLGDKPYEVRYWSLPANRSPSGTSHKVLSQDDVVRLPLKAPFKYNADISKSSKRKFSIIIKWYFMLKGLLHDGVGGDYNDYCKRFCDALRKIEAGQRSEEEKSRQGDYVEGSQETQMTVDESPEPDKPKSVYKLRSAPHQGEQAGRDDTKIVSSKPAQLATPADTPSTSDRDGETDYDKLCRYLDSHGILYLLQNIPEADAVQFVDQGFLPDAQPKKLFLGRHAKNDCEIYAYMRPLRNFHEINFWMEDPRRPLNITSMRTEDVAKQRILHPFNKTYPKDGPIDQGDRARLTLMVKWYFIASGIARNTVLQETKAYPDRLRSALEYIALRMGPAAAKPPKSDDSNPPDHPVSHRPNTTTINESHIQTSLALPVSSPPTTTTTTLPSRPSPRGTKRPASATTEDADFESLAATILQDQTLTKQINAIDGELELMEIRKQVFLDKWDSEFAEVVERRKGIEEQRGGVRKRFKRMSLKVAGGGEGG